MTHGKHLTRLGLGTSPDVLTIHATVDFIDETSGAQSEVQLLYPREEDIAAVHFSTLTPVGAGLIGRREG